MRTTASLVRTTSKAVPLYVETKNIVFRSLPRRNGMRPHVQLSWLHTDVRPSLFISGEARMCPVKRDFFF